ncbi:uncharacterized protein ANIA_09516 [Aspergillus nidulans FGSC A4]|uniref:Zn(II)2Cys6 transcription factor (Eurofung) n=1 Tax=Emericella nidulans (strain FGSC A4 / ATCC 38163 / CBS 112.46 / NRRL 194 / M139) TaxID=227321 RepID=C8VS80_EMENI|nr:hypothetical protein [Aspergillus nidulans FGSC A4]CBF87757.1 TPA: Putative Zn(II)2Cys6 transcription factor (Eurofung) [Aspergillus nidulans FGSC A4]
MASVHTTPSGRPIRRGLGNACQLCRLRKVRCDRVKPACENCRLARIPCVFSSLSDRPRRTVHQSHVQKLEVQLRERCLSPGLTLAGTRLSDPGRFDTALATFQWHLSFCDLPDSFDLAGFSNELVKTVGPVAPSELAVVKPKWPSSQLVRSALEYFKKTHLYSVFPVVDVDETAQIIKDNELDLNDASIDTRSRACLGAFTALITGLRRDEPVFVAAGADPIAHVRAVLTLLPDLVLQDRSPRALETLLMTALYITPMGEPQTSEALLSLAVRIVFNTGANRAETERKSPHLRAMFWLLYSFDKENSLRRSQPPLIHDADCDLDLPSTYLFEYTDYHFFQNELSSHALLYPSDLRMALLKSRIYRLLYSVEAQRQSEARRLQRIRELDQELVNLKASFPRHCQPDDFAKGLVPDTLFHDLSLRGANIHLGYYFCLTKIHSATAGGGMSPPASSIELCYQAARSTLLYIRRVQNCIIPETFWIYFQYLTTAVLALYRRLLVASDVSQVREDVQILEDTAGIFARLSTTNAERGNFFAPYKIAENFVSKITALAKESIMRSPLNGSTQEDRET